LNPSIHGIRWRLFWTSLIALVLAIGCFSLAQWAYAPSDDRCLWSVQSATQTEQRQRVVIGYVSASGSDGAATLADGDELIAIHDIKVPEYTDKLTLQENQRQLYNAVKKMIVFLNSVSDGTTVQYTVIRDGQRITIPVELKKVFDATNALLLFTGIVAWAIGLLVVLSSPQRKVARHFYYLGALTLLLAAGSSTRGAYIYTAPLGIDLITRTCLLLFNCLFPPMWFHFFLRFPYGFEIRKHRFFLAGIYAINALALLPGIIMVGVALLSFNTSDWAIRLLLDTLPIDVNIFESISKNLQLIILISGLLLFWIGALKVSDHRRKALMAPLLFTTALFLDLLAYLWLTNLYANSPEWDFFYRSSYYFFLPAPFLPLIFAYAILRHGFFNVRQVVVRWLTYFVFLGALVAAYLAILAWTFPYVMPEKIHMSWLGVIMGLSALPLAWIFRWQLATLRRRFRRDVSSARDLMLGNLRNTKKRFSDDALLESLKASIQEAYRPQVCHCLPFVGGRVILPPAHPSGAGHSIGHEAGELQDFRLPPAMLRHAKENRELVYGLTSDESDWVVSQSRALRAYMDAMGVQVMVLLMAGDQPHSVLLLGGKYAELNYSREDRELLREVAIAAGILLESAVMHKRLIDKTRLDQELQAARNIQESLITSKPPDIPGFQIASRLLPAMETGGDLLWVKERAPGRWIAVVGDVSGKGLAAAIYMSQSMALLNLATRDPDVSLEKVLSGMDSALRSMMSPKDFLTLCIAEWDEGGYFKVVRAGHPPPIYLSGASPGEPISVIPSGLALGMRPASPINWQVYEGLLQPGDWLAMYSDGLTEAMDHNGNLYGIDRLKGQLARFWGTGSVRAACEAVFQQVAAFEVQNRDDRTLFILSRRKHE